MRWPWQRSYFRADAAAAELDIILNAEGQPTRTLTNRLPLGEIESLALPYESYTAASTDDLLAQLFTAPANVSPEMLLAGGYHQEPDSSGYWWIPSGQQSFDEAKFYLSEVTRDPFAVDTHSAYDVYVLMTVAATDALGNHIQANANYRVLQPEQVTDPNGNRAAVTFNALGLVAGSAVMGKESENLGDELTDNFKADLTQNEIDAFIAIRAQTLRNYWIPPPLASSTTCIVIKIPGNPLLPRRWHVKHMPAILCRPAV